MGSYSPVVKIPSTRKDDVLLLPGTTEPPKCPVEKVKAQSILTPGINTAMSVAPFPKIVKLPKVRVFVCGSEAEKCAWYILRDSDIEVVYKNYGYSNVEFSMATDCFDNVVISKVCSNLFSTNNHVFPGNSASNQCRCKCCGNDFHANGVHNKARSVINVEMHIVPDDKLFHNCCSYLFSKSSVFILTFDCEKLLQTKTELTRMQNLSHTVRSFAEECHITLCGLLGNLPETSNVRDEVQALFYGPYNTQLQQYNVYGPELFDTHFVPTDNGNFSDNQQLSVLLWKSVSDSVQRQGTLQPLLAVLDYLNTIRDKELYFPEDYFTSVIKSILPEYEMDVHYTILTDLGMMREVIRESE